MDEIMIKHWASLVEESREPGEAVPEADDSQEDDFREQRAKSNFSQQMENYEKLFGPVREIFPKDSAQAVVSLVKAVATIAKHNDLELARKQVEGTNTIDDREKAAILKFARTLSNYLKNDMFSGTEGGRDEVDESLPGEGVGADGGISDLLSNLASECREMERKAKEDGTRIYEYEGQRLANFWLHLGRVADSLSKGNLNPDIARELKMAGEQILNSDTHRTPKPTDPLDVA